MEKETRTLMIEGFTYEQFLDTCKVLKMLYGRDVAETFFTNNIVRYYDIGSESILVKKG